MDLLGHNKSFPQNFVGASFGCLMVRRESQNPLGLFWSLFFEHYRNSFCLWCLSRVRVVFLSLLNSLTTQQWLLSLTLVLKHKAQMAMVTKNSSKTFYHF